MATPQDLPTFSMLLASLDYGQIHDELTNKVQEIVSGIQNEFQARGGKPKATLTLKLDFKLDSGMVEIKADVKSTLPLPERGKTSLWVTPDNHLTTVNPRQREFEFRDVNNPAAARDVL